MKIYKNFFIVLICIITLQSCLNNNTDICVQGDCFNGEGTYNFSNGDIFKGNFINGQLDKGTYYFNNGTKYSGTWKNGNYKWRR